MEKRKGIVSVIVSFVLIISAALMGCTLDRSGLGPPPEPTPVPRPRPGAGMGEPGVPDSWTAAAYPGFACPADEITLQWNVGDPTCPAGTGPECQTLSVVDNFTVLEPPFTSRQLTGTHSWGSISSNVPGWDGTVSPRFTFSVSHDDPADRGWSNIISIVQMIRNPPAPPYSQRFAFFGLCEPVSGRWSLTDFRLDMDSDAFIRNTRGLGNCVRIVSICYNPSSLSGSLRYDPIIISLIGGDGSMPSRTLSVGECIDGLNLRPDLSYQVVPDPSVPILERMGGRCVEGTTTDPLEPPPYINLDFTLRCDTELPECGN